MAKYSFSTKPRSQKLLGDMEFLGAQLMRDPNKVALMFNKFSDDPFVSFFSQLGISTNEEGVPAVSQMKHAESLIRWRIKDNTKQAIRILSATSSLPETITAGMTFDLELDQGWPLPDAVFVMEDDRTNIWITERKPSIGQGYKYTFQYVSVNPTDTLSRKDLLGFGHYINYTGNAKPEFSTTSQDLSIDAGFYDMFNVSQVIRHKIAKSGHFLSTEVKSTVLQEWDSNGKNIIREAALDFDGTMLREHLKSVGKTLFFQRTNFNPITRRVMSHTLNNANSDTPMMAGALEQFEWTSNVGEYEVNDNIANTSKLLQAKFEYLASYYRQNDIKYVIVTGSGGDRVLQDVLQYEALAGLPQYRQQIAPGEVINVGNTFGTFTTRNYSWKVVNVEYSATERGHQSEMVGYKGGYYPKSSFNMYAIPLYKLDDGRRNVRIVAKAKDGINRALVIGTMPGMSGLYNGGDADFTKPMSDMDKAKFAVSVADRYKVASPTDGELTMALSEVSLIVGDPDSILWMKPVFA